MLDEMVADCNSFLTGFNFDSPPIPWGDNIDSVGDVEQCPSWQMLLNGPFYNDAGTAYGYEWLAIDEDQQHGNYGHILQHQDCVGTPSTAWSTFFAGLTLRNSDNFQDIRNICSARIPLVLYGVRIRLTNYGHMCVSAREGDVYDIGPTFVCPPSGCGGIGDANTIVGACGSRTQDGANHILIPMDAEFPLHIGYPPTDISGNLSLPCTGAFTGGIWDHYKGFAVWDTSLLPNGQTFGCCLPIGKVCQDCACT